MNESQELRRLSRLLEQNLEEQQPWRGDPTGAEWAEKIESIRNDIATLQMKIERLHLAPSIAGKFKSYLDEMYGYFRDSIRHYDHFKKPSLYRRRR